MLKEEGKGRLRQGRGGREGRGSPKRSLKDSLSDHPLPMGLLGDPPRNPPRNSCHLPPSPPSSPPTLTSLHPPSMIPPSSPLAYLCRRCLRKLRGAARKVSAEPLGFFFAVLKRNWVGSRC